MSTQTTAADPRAPRTTLMREALRLVVLAGLAIDAYVHFHLASNFDGLKGSGRFAVSQGQLFRVEAVAAIVAGLLVLFLLNRITALIAFAVLVGGVSAVLLYTYVDIGAIGPLPSMHDPIWYAEKTISAVAQAVAAVAALLLAFLLGRRRSAVA